MMTIKSKNANPLLQNRDISNEKTKLEKDITKQSNEAKAQKAQEEAAAKGEGEQPAPADQEDDSERSEESD